MLAELDISDDYRLEHDQLTTRYGDCEHGKSLPRASGDHGDCGRLSINWWIGFIGIRPRMRSRIALGRVERAPSQADADEPPFGLWMI
jgi:hypothetical protein